MLQILVPAFLKKGRFFKIMTEIVGEKRCVFNIPGLEAHQDDRCRGMLTRHHLLYQSEGGSDEPHNLVWCCRRHQAWIHKHGEKWGDEDFSFLKRDWEQSAEYKKTLQRRERHRSKSDLLLGTAPYRTRRGGNNGHNGKNHNGNGGRSLVPHGRRA